MNENCSAVDGLGDGVISRPSLAECLEILGTFHVEHIRDGAVIWEEDFRNTVTTEGKNAMLDKFLGLGAAYAAIAMGLHTTVGNASSTYATPSPQVEGTSYTGNRPAPSFASASGGSKATSSNVSFAITGSMTVTGAFVALGASGITTKSDTAATAILLSSGAFSSSRAVVNLDTLSVSWSLAL